MLVTDMASALLGTALTARRKTRRQSILAQSQGIAWNITTTDSSSASSLGDTVSGMRRQFLEKTKLLMKRLILIKQTQTTTVTNKQIIIKCYIGLRC